MISHVWEHPLIQLVIVSTIPGTTKESTYSKCLAPGCSQQCSGKNATKALAHGSQDCKYCIAQHVKPCSDIASQGEINIFGALLTKKLNKKAATKRGSDLIAEEILVLQSLVSEGWSAKKAKPSPAYACTNTALSVASSELTPASIDQIQRQLNVATAFAKNTIECSDSANLDSTIAQMVYCKTLLFSFESAHISNV